jgi:hypothetical protein
MVNTKNKTNRYFQLVILSGLLISGCMTTKNVPETRTVSVPVYEDVNVAQKSNLETPVFRNVDGSNFTGTIPVALMGFTESNNQDVPGIRRNVLDMMNASQIRRNRIQVYDFSDVSQALGISSDATNRNNQVKLNENMIPFSITGRINSRNPLDITLSVYRNEDGVRLNSVNFKDSRGSTAIDDIADFLFSNRTVTYTTQRVQTGTTTRRETTNKQVQEVDWGSTIILGLLLYLLIANAGEAPSDS